MNVLATVAFLMITVKGDGSEDDSGFTYDQILAVAVPPALFGFFSLFFAGMCLYCQPSRHPERDTPNSRCPKLCSTSSVERIRRVCLLVMWLSVCVLLTSWVRLSWTFFAIILAILCIVWSFLFTWAIRFSSTALGFEGSFAFQQSSELRTTLYVLAVFWAISTAVAIYVAADLYIAVAASCGFTVTRDCFGVVNFVYQIFFIASMLSVSVCCVVLGHDWHQACQVIARRNEAIRAESKKQRDSLHVAFRGVTTVSAPTGSIEEQDESRV
ncbi:hypothetical protein BASA81_002073 [Batrachochytrium salamandrivorans]|nr:hypothetical protein BASA81_002073 [Batrachochytrium salamandrivorans]